jgi:DNA-binding response OmpR family regulator
MRVFEGAEEKPAVLIVDDSLTVRMDLHDTFAGAGFAATACETLETARAVLANQSFSLVVLDVLLPDGDGIDLLREIKGLPPPAVPVMLLSSEAEVRDRVRGLQTGADDYVGKPYDRGYILARARQLAGAGGRAAGRSAIRILLIDDSPTFRHQFQSLLEAAGYRVDSAETGQDGLHTAFAVRPDAIIVDRWLPGAMDGPAVIRRLREDVALRNTPILLLTGSTESGDELRALDAGADAYLTKELDVKVILARLAATLRAGRALPIMDAPASSLLGAKKILAVDHSPTFLNEISAELRQEGYDVVQAGSGKEALQLLDLQPVDCVLMDVRMPGLSGNETCQLIRQRPALRNIPVLMLTSMEGPEAVIEGINAGADDYISKSADFTVLKAHVRAQLRRKQFEDEHRSIREELLRKELDRAQARAAQEIAEAQAAMADELERKNRELEAFTYSVSHDLRAPLRTVRGFTQALLDDFGAQLPAGAQDHVDRVQRAAVRMSKLIDALLELSRSGRAELHREAFDLSALARSVAVELAELSDGRHVDYAVQEGIAATADAALVRVVLNNLLGNAWKYTAKAPSAEIQVGALDQPGGPVYFVRDNGVGFDSAHAKHLFEPFQRLHPATEFPGAGIGLATVRRIVERHRGKVWAESAVGQGATFFFTLDASSSPHGQSSGSDTTTLVLEQA